MAKLIDMEYVSFYWLLIAKNSYEIIYSVASFQNELWKNQYSTMERLYCNFLIPWLQICNENEYGNKTQTLLRLVEFIDLTPNFA